MNSTEKVNESASPAGATSPAIQGIDTRLVYGFLDAGKTTYIRENVLNDVFWKYGSTLILCFEQGEEQFDAESLAQKKACAVCYDGGDITAFCLDAIEKYKPDRIYVEMNAMTEGLREALPECMRKTFAITLIDWETMALYYTNFMPMMRQMVTDSQQVIFRGCPSADLLLPYSQSFRLMNPKASYLRRDPMGYHEKAFGMFLPYSLEDAEIMIGEESFLPFWLDALDHPEHYEGTAIVFADPVEMRKTGNTGTWACGRVVMTCCMQDLQFMAFETEISAESAAGIREGWVTGRAAANVAAGEFGRRKLRLRIQDIRYTAAPEEMILDGRRPRPVTVCYKGKPAFIWDLDGTLLDSYKVIVPDLRDAFSAYPGTPDTEEISRLVITHDVATAIRKAAEAAGISFAEMKARYDGISGKRNHEICLIPGAKKALEMLAAGGARHFVVTHRGSSSEDVLKRLKIYDLFEEVVTGRNGFPRKPAPDAVNYLVEKYGLDRENSWYVGDRTIDTDCAANAGIKGILYLPAGSPCNPNGRESLIVGALPDIAEKCLPH